MRSILSADKLRSQSLNLNKEGKDQDEKPHATFSLNIPTASWEKR